MGKSDLSEHMLCIAQAEAIIDIVRGEIELGDTDGKPVVRLTMNRRTLSEFTRCRVDTGEEFDNPKEFQGVPIITDESLGDAAIECHGLGDGPVGMS